LLGGREPSGCLERSDNLIATVLHVALDVDFAAIAVPGVAVELAGVV
jgi:hypothetical protein